MMRSYAKKQGIIFITAIIALTVMLLIGTMFMSMSSQQLRDAVRDFSALQATAMADGGLNYAISIQRNPISRISNIYSSTQIANLRTLTPTSQPTPQFTMPTGIGDGQGKFAVWLTEYRIGGTLVGYQLVSKGYYRNYDRAVRAILQGARPASQTDFSFQNFKYAIFARAGMSIDSSTNVNGDIGSLGAVTLNYSGGGGLRGGVFTDGGVILGKNNIDTSYIPDMTYGSKVFDSKGKDVTGQVNTYFPTSTISNQGLSPAEKQKIPVMNPDNYKTMADAYGSAAYYNGTSLTSAGQITTPILYCNSNKTSGYTLSIKTSLEGPAIIFVNGDVSIDGNSVLGTKPETYTDSNHNGKWDSGEPYVDANGDGNYDAGKPVMLIATGNIINKGTVDINGVVWAGGSFGNGTPTVNGMVLCENIAGFQGNPQLYYNQFANTTTITIPNGDDMWKIDSWELL